MKYKRPNASESDRMKAVSIEWAKLSAEQKRFYHEESKLDKEKYEKAIDEWNQSLNNKLNKQIVTLDEKRQRSMVNFLSHGQDFNQVSIFGTLSGNPSTSATHESNASCSESEEGDN